MTFDGYDENEERALQAHEYRIRRCRARECNARIVWLKTAAGKTMPVDADSVEPSDTAFDPKRHVSHFATCPASTRFRQPR